MRVSQSPVWDEIFKIMAEDRVSEVQANGPDDFFLKAKGQRERINLSAGSEEDYMESVRIGLAPFVMSLNEFDPRGYLFEGRIKYTYNNKEVSGRCHIVMPPAADYPQITIAKKTASLLSPDVIAAAGSMSSEMLAFMKMAMEAKLTIVFSGGTGAGKDLHKDTLIPTAKGLRKVSQINIGDKIFDENGKETCVLDKYAPKDQRHYEVTFNNGFKIRSGMGHIWKVGFSSDAPVKWNETHRLFSNSELNNMIASIENTDETLVNILELMNIIQGNPMNMIINYGDKPRMVERIISGFGTRAKDMFSFYKDDVIARAKTLNSPKSGEIIANVLDINNDQVTLPELTKIVNDEDLLNALVPEISRIANNVFYNRREVLMYLLQNNASLLEAISTESELTQYANHLITTEKLLKLGVLDSQGNYRFFVDSFNGTVNYDEQELSVDPYVYGQSAVENIDEIYKTSSKAQRVALINGIMNSHGSVVNDDSVRLRFGNEKLVQDAHEVVASLGWMPTAISVNEDYEFVFHPSQGELVKPLSNGAVFLGGYDNNAKNHRNYIVAITEVHDNNEDYFCFAVDSPTHMYLASSAYIPTHNTTMLEALSKSIPDQYRIGVAEDTPELVLTQSNISYLRSVPHQPGMDPNDVATLSWVVQQFQRMRTDRVIIGETRGKEFADFLVAANSGMDGSMTTMHAENPVRCLNKMTSFALKGSENTPLRSINNEIANAIDIIVQLVIVDGKHRVSHIQEITPTLGNTDEAKITTQPLYCWDRESDLFYKEENMTDNLRQEIMSRGINIDQFTTSERGIKYPAHVNNVSQRSAPRQQSQPVTQTRQPQQSQQPISQGRSQNRRFSAPPQNDQGSQSGRRSL